MALAYLYFKLSEKIAPKKNKLLLSFCFLDKNTVMYDQNERNTLKFLELNFLNRIDSLLVSPDCDFFCSEYLQSIQLVYR
jgi:hypothetical protein